jgi:anaerobic selenocysteine-containing dehydrogenase
MRAIGSPMLFNVNTIDKPGRAVAASMHGNWMAPVQGFHEPDVALLVGLNSFHSYYGVACGHPGKWLGERLDAGMQLIVVDPRRSEIARRATLHLQPVPGEDPAILAGLIRVIIREGLFDADFVAENATGLEALERVVDPFTPDTVARRADISARDLARAAEMFAAPARGYCVGGVGPGFSNSSTLINYLILNLETLCGHYLRAGERVARAVTLMPAFVYKAQPASPRPWSTGEAMRVHGLTVTPAGLPTGVLADEILTEGEGQVRALISCGGNPVAAWPDQLKTIEAMQKVDLLVQFDPWMSQTARYAHYVIAPTMAYEVPGATLVTDVLIATHYYGPAEAYAQYTPALVDPPFGSDVITEWQFFFRLARRMGLKLVIRPTFSDTYTALDMKSEPTADEILQILTAGARVPLEEVQRHPHGATFPEPPTYVLPRDAGWAARLDLANPEMMADLRRVAKEVGQAELARADRDESEEPFSFRLITRRLQHTMNSTSNVPETNRGRPYNPAFMHPDDLIRLGLHDGDGVEICSRRASIPAVVIGDSSLRTGLVSMAHGFGGAPDRDGEFRQIGSPTGRLLDNTDFADPYVGMPRISNIPVRVVPFRENRQ